MSILLLTVAELFQYLSRFPQVPEYKLNLFSNDFLKELQI